MTRTVVLLRGVNIGGRRLPMATLRDGLTEAGCEDVVTYVQSGNVVLTPPTTAGDDTGPWLEARIGEIAGFPVAVVVRDAAALAGVVAANPYPAAEGARLHVVFLGGSPAADVLGDLDLTAFAPEHGTAVGWHVYLSLPLGMGRAQLPVAIEKVTRRSPATVTTTRNWNTVLELLRLATA